ncbi:PREDICTED: serine/threonine-protein phosphatase 6 regulatory ankyrin repeat subunit A-like [Camelina sativa]|uniref:Serine/threonine-protein phosphatase 6 regulatory ankyrin repeat subunit A-like n=1 Tax=Camelina sativa TaxID=90675 RepID=A0ABM0W095_CAMSA|nr:PREDICTED: serine/threonine-protein phosphatase 6 regulatory ankyrin repeat subunit A-like [Camelina sativa]
MPPPIFPLRWESTGDQWWYASPIDCAAANGLYDVVIELLHQDTNLLVKLTSLRRIRRLETVWDDGDGNNYGGNNNCHVALNRARVARRLLEECEIGNGDNSLIRAGYGGWLLYTAASAGDLEFVKKLLERDPLLVFGEGEYGVTDILYAAARGRNDDVFRLVLDFALLPADIAGVEEINGKKLTERQLIVKEEMVKRGVHSAARGGHVTILDELLPSGRYDDVSKLRDAFGSTLLHSASSRAQIEVVKYLVSKYDSIMEVQDSHGNTALHIAAYKGHLDVVEVLINESPPLISVVNGDGDTFLHTVVSGFAASGFKRLDRQMELLKKLVVSEEVDFSEIVNVRNCNGRTVIHLAVMDNLNAVRPDVVESLLRIPSVDLNVVDSYGMTAVDLLKRQTPKTLVSELLIKRLVSAGGRSNCGESVSRFREERYGFCGSPGTSFEISDSEIFLFTAARTDHTAELRSPERESFDGISECSTEISTHSKRKRHGSGGGGTGARLKLLLRWAKKEESEENNNNNRRVPLREMYSPSGCNRGGGRAFPMRTESGDLPSLAVRLKFTQGLMKGVVVQESPRFVFSPPAVSDYSGAPSSACSSPFQTVSSELGRRTPAMKKKKGSFMDRYLCFGGKGLAIDGSSEINNGSGHRLRPRSFKRAISLVSS